MKRRLHDKSLWNKSCKLRVKFIALNFSHCSHVWFISYNCTIMKSNLCAIEFQSSATVNHKQDLSVLPEQSGQTIRTNQDSGSVSPWRAANSDQQDQPGQGICQPMQSSQVRPSGPARTVDLSAHTERSSRTIRTNQDSGTVSPYRAFKPDHQDQPGQWICQPKESSQVGPSGPTRTVDLSAHKEQSSQTIRTNQDSGSVSP